jgi:pimeloyl-ACP methyl ester carboxylesterase
MGLMYLPEVMALSGKLYARILTALAFSAAAFGVSSPISHYERPTSANVRFGARVIVFVHGIFGNAEDAWRNSPSDPSWPKLLTTDHAFDDFDIYVANYETPRFGNTMTVDEVVASLNNRLIADGVYNHREIVFVCHSLGGIVVQRLLLTFRERASQVPFVYFFAVPSEGAQMARLGSLFNSDPLLKALLNGNENEYLLNLDNEWRAAKFRIRRFCAYEKKTTSGFLIVDRLSATRNCDETPIPINADHVSIVKPRSINDDSYIALRNAIRDSPPTQPLRAPAHSKTDAGPARKSGGISPDVTILPKNTNLRENGLALSKDILSFLEERQRTNPAIKGPPFFGAGESQSRHGEPPPDDDKTPPYMKATRDLFNKKFEGRIADLHDGFSRLGLQDLELERSYTHLPTIFGNVDLAIQHIARSVRRLALLCPPAGLYSGMSDAQLAETAIQEADRIDGMTDKAMKELRSSRAPDGIRWSFFGDFQQCCLNQVEYLRSELLARLGPSAFDSREMDEFNGFNGLADIEMNQKFSLATVIEYLPRFRALADKLKQKSESIAIKP